jgi:GNAT superfamily N-acetyltransferase
MRACSEQAFAHPFGEAFFSPSLPRAYALNTLYVDAEVDADQLVAALDELYADFGHRRAAVERADTGERLCEEMRRRGWLVERDLYMALRRPRDRDPAAGLAREVDQPTLQAAELATVREEPYARQEDVARELVAMRARFATGVATVRFFVGRADDVDAAVTTLYSDGRTAQIEDVATLQAFRRRGLARATVTAAIDAAVAMDHALVFIVADVDDWPKDLYARLGFDPIGSAWVFTRPGPEYHGGETA